MRIDALQAEKAAAESKATQLEAALNAKTAQLDAERVAHENALADANRAAEARLEAARTDAAKAAEAAAATAAAAADAAGRQASAEARAEALMLQRRVDELEQAASSAADEASAELRAAVARAQAEADEAARQRIETAVAETQRLAAEAEGASEVRHAEELAALRRVHAEEVAALRAREEDAKAIGALSDKVRTTAGSLEHLQQKVAAEAAETSALRTTQLEVRERLVGELEEASRLTQQRAENEARRLQEMLAAVDAQMKKQRRQQDEDRALLRAEHARLAALQESVKAEAEIGRSELVQDKARLLEMQAAFDKERRDILHGAQEARLQAGSVCVSLCLCVCAGASTIVCCFN